jgi:hypothetical protein
MHRALYKSTSKETKEVGSVSLGNLTRFKRHGNGGIEKKSRHIDTSLGAYIAMHRHILLLPHLDYRERPVADPM